VLGLELVLPDAKSSEVGGQLRNIFWLWICRRDVLR